METVHSWSRYTSYSKYTVHNESILVLWVLAVSTNGRDTVSTCQYPQYRTLEYLKYGGTPQYWTPKYCEYSQYPQYKTLEIPLSTRSISRYIKTKTLRVHEVPAVYSRFREINIAIVFEVLSRLHKFPALPVSRNIKILNRTFPIKRSALSWYSPLFLSFSPFALSSFPPILVHPVIRTRYQVSLF